MKTKESMIKNAAILCLATLLAFSAVILIKGWIGGSFRSIDSLRVYVASFGIWAPLVLMLIQLFLTILPVCTSFAGCVVGAALFGAAGAGIEPGDIFQLMNYAVLFIILIFACMPLGRQLFRKIPEKVQGAVETVLIMGGLLLSIAYLVDSTYNPFLYFRF